MRFQIVILTIILLAVFNWLPQKRKRRSTQTMPSNKNTNVATANTNNPLSATTATPGEAKTNNAPTISPVVKAYYEALKNKDEAALRKVFSQDTLKSLEADMKEENQKSHSKIYYWISKLFPTNLLKCETKNLKATQQLPKCAAEVIRTALILNSSKKMVNGK